MKKLLLIAVLISFFANVSSSNEQLLQQLDSILVNRENYTKEKLHKIDFLKKRLMNERDVQEQMKLCRDLYDEYYVFNFDSAQVYVNKGLELAIKSQNHYYIALNTILRSELLAIGGLYSEAAKNLDVLQAEKMDSTLLLKYYTTYFSLYSYWASYCNNEDFSPSYRALAIENLRKAIPYLSSKDNVYHFFMGEYYIYAERNDKKALDHYFQVLKNSPIHSRLYAMASFAVANNFNAHHDALQYEEYLIKACISDVISCTKENLAMQYLAMYLFDKGENYIERAEKYISVSMEDAKFYNNRLRIIELSKKFPDIMATYQTMVKRQNSNLRVALILISLSVIGLIVATLFIVRQNKLLTSRRKALAVSNTQLSQLNEQLSVLNRQLLDTNSKRERLAKLYIDLCAKYIDRLRKYQTMVKRKIKANQVSEILNTMSSSRLSEQDAITFMNKFDKAFLDLYPTFLHEFNLLLTETHRMDFKQQHGLTTEMRIFALIRLGVKESSEIADLLFYSPQTIYNYRSLMKNKAINRESFEQDVQKLCTVINVSEPV
ncbi:MAG: DUF6377 domain-containing protein [Prevotellaceae bacterium]|nr:DUF6377 domain-containing protein [Prevotellaceae bacterium]MDY3366410.1 DUF6377 domain-containing protein [Prevotella sp.]